MYLQYESFENAVENGEIACNEQFLLFPQRFLHFCKRKCCLPAFSPFHQCFLEASFSRSLKVELCGIGLRTLGKKSFEKIVRKGENAGNQYFLFFLNWCLFNKIKTATFNPFPNKPWFLHVCSRSLLKTLWKKEKLLVMSNFSFSHSVFYPQG